MITAKEAFDRANNFNDISWLKIAIQDEILKACENGSMKASIALNKRFNEIVKTVIIEWLKKFGYRGDFQEYVDAGSGWSIPTLEISWEEVNDGNH